MTIEYKGFQIDELTFNIYKGGKPIFTAWWQRNETLDQAKETIDASFEMKEKMQKKPDLGKSFDGFKDHCELENGFEDKERQERQSDERHELELLNPQN